ncbi:MAG: thermonuclease family protein [Candidatus Eisenbacteria bacterium]
MRTRLLSHVLAPLVLLLAACATHSTIETERAIPVPKDRVEYDDGDTFSFGETTIRVLGIDTPEITHREHGFFEDQPFGREAAAFTERTLRRAKRITYLPYQNDRYGRLLAHVFVDGELLAVRLIREGLAYESITHYGDNGFPEIAAAILKAAKESPKPAFESPHTWRREHRREPAEN